MTYNNFIINLKDHFGVFIAVSYFPIFLGLNH